MTPLTTSFGAWLWTMIPPSKELLIDVPVDERAAQSGAGRGRRQDDATKVRTGGLEHADVAGDGVGRDGATGDRAARVVGGVDDAARSEVAGDRVVADRVIGRIDTGLAGPALGAPGSTGPLSLTKTPPPPLLMMVLFSTEASVTPASTMPPND